MVILRRLIIEQRHLKSLALRPPIFKPELYILWLQPRELLPVRHTIEFLRVLQYQIVRRVCVQRKPLLQSRHFRHWIYEGAIALPALVRWEGGHPQDAGARRRCGGMRQSRNVVAHIHDTVTEHGVWYQRKPRRQTVQAGAGRTTHHLTVHVRGAAVTLRVWPACGRSSRTEVVLALIIRLGCLFIHIRQI